MAIQKSAKHILPGVYETMAGYCETDGIPKYGVLYVYVCVGCGD